METLNEYGLATVKDIPLWIAKVPFFRRLWFNPVFQRNYRNSRVRKLIEPSTAFLVGLILSVILSGIMIVAAISVNEAFVAAVTVALIGATFAVLFIFTWVRMFISCLINTPRELQKDVGKGDLNTILTAPISDADLYFAEILPNFVRGMEVLKSLYNLLLGLAIPVIPSLFITFILGTRFDPEVCFNAAMVVLASLIVMFAALIMMMLLTSITVGTFAINQSIAGAIAGSIFYSYFILNFAGLGMALTAMLIETTISSVYGPYYVYGMSPVYGSLLAIILTVVGSLMIIWACTFTAHIGINTLGKVRREGFYRPEMSNAAGLR